MNDNPLNKNTEKKSIQLQHIEYAGPIPPPQILEGYNNIVQGAAERIIKMAEDQAAHRRKLEQNVINSDNRNSLVGIVCAFIITIGVLFIAYVAITLHATTAGVIIGALGISSLVGTFIFGTNSRRVERQNRKD